MNASTKTYLPMMPVSAVSRKLRNFVWENSTSLITINFRALPTVKNAMRKDRASQFDRLDITDMSTAFKVIRLHEEGDEYIGKIPASKIGATGHVLFQAAKVHRQPKGHPVMGVTLNKMELYSDDDITPVVLTDRFSNADSTRLFIEVRDKKPAVYACNI